MGNQSRQTDLILIEYMSHREIGVTFVQVAIRGSCVAANGRNVRMRDATATFPILLFSHEAASPDDRSKREA